jgi:septation ring formation regulator EzrA
MSLKTAEEAPAQGKADDFRVLEEKIYRIIESFKAAQQARSVVERDVKRLREQLRERDEEIESLRREMVQLRRDREQVRDRVEKMLQQIDDIAEQQAAS